jgi:hypothetical protein
MNLLQVGGSTTIRLEIMMIYLNIYVAWLGLLLWLLATTEYDLHCHV